MLEKWDPLTLHVKVNNYWKRVREFLQKQNKTKKNNQTNQAKKSKFVSTTQSSNCSPLHLSQGNRVTYTQKPACECF